MSQNDHAVTANDQHVHRDDIGSKMGMWLFLFTELLLFGGMFLIYAVYRFQHTELFKLAALELDTAVGTLNTIILLTSSLTVALAITALQKGNKFLSILNLVITIVFALTFMVNKFFEWSVKFSHGIYPGSEDLTSKQNGEILFFGLYYVMTGLHGLHVVIGVALLTYVLVLIIKNKITSENFIKLENSGLYWHLVDLIWIFLFPLFYLIH
ncbi:MAG: cytochrome c oxidase subunit 3 family protein [Melioribacteraceae bacterium]|nr:cytochrome c oxidase subunit 3 family protein [Melioribacteraceae bacterium]MCF8354412.1 cytochrome c oxidase subunit 3 family protein [Melioribacteraceae bacterium]MCF8392991.1 cytochrome c oxidase subunit 3 family protein [Melioribacteraceae bacterium]MCF8417266.1 cytochrome c oxidase subunit 3 family protein [Melioribacteraceae bacterium]